MREFAQRRPISAWLRFSTPVKETMFQHGLNDGVFLLMGTSLRAKTVGSDLCPKFPK